MEINKGSNFELKLDELDESQLKVVTSKGENILLRAPAGSGKTTSLINAIAVYRYEHLLDRICAITYTRAARAEMEERLKEMGIHDVEVTTIHVWARNLLQDFSIKYNFKIKILQEPQIKDILQEIVDDYIVHSKIKSINLDILYSFIMGNKNMDIKDSYKRTLMALETRYIKYKRDNVLYDFTDYPLYLYNVLVTFDEAINNIDALFVDEYQDVDETQFEIFQKVNANKKFFVGDAWQSIFVFRGADGAVFKKTADFEEYKLVCNYRSYQEIIDYAVTVYLALQDKADFEETCYISEIMWMRPSHIECIRGRGGSVTVINPFGRNIKFENGLDHKINVIDDFKNFMSNRPMILCRTNKQVKWIQDKGYFETSTIHQAKGLEYNNVIVIDTTICGIEDLNIAYVAMTRARDNLFVVNWQQFELLFNMYWN